MAGATAVWSGISGAYDPRLVVHHHHGRKTQREDKDLWNAYDKARGAYYAKFILRSDTRLEYLKMWMLTIVNGLQTGRRTIKKETRTAGLRERYFSARHSMYEFYGALQYVFVRR